MNTFASKKRIVILGSGFGGIATARHLERLFGRRPDVEIILVSRDNFLLVTPLLFEVFSGAIDLRSCSFPVRAALRHAVHRGRSPGHRPRPARGSPGNGREVHRAGLRPIGADARVQDEPRNDSRLGACLYIQDPGRRPVAPQPRHRAVRARRRRDRCPKESAAPHIRRYRRRVGRSRIARRAVRLRERHHSSLQAHRPRRSSLALTPRWRPDHAGNRSRRSRRTVRRSSPAGLAWTCGQTHECGLSNRARFIWWAKP